LAAYGAVAGAHAKPAPSNCGPLLSKLLPGCHVEAAPAPMIGSGAPAALVVGGILLGVTFFMRRRQS